MGKTLKILLSVTGCLLMLLVVSVYFRYGSPETRSRYVPNRYGAPTPGTIVK